MGGLTALIGGLAGGYTQAAQVDQQRKFEDEQNRRASLGDLFGKLMSDETADPQLRAWALQQRLAIPKAPYKEGKPYQPDFRTYPAGKPAQPARGVTQPPIGSAPPQPPQGMMGPRQFPANMPQMGGMQPPSGAPSGAPLAAGAAGPPAPPEQAPSISFAPPPPPPSLLTQPGQSVNLAAQPAQPIIPFMSPEQNTARLAAREGAEAEAGIRGQVAGRTSALPSGLSPEASAAFKLGIPSYFRTANQSIGQGEKVPGEQLLAMYPDEAKAAGVQPGQFYNTREMAGGRRTFEPTAGPGQVADTGGGLISPTQAAQQKGAVSQSFWQSRNGVQFQQSLAKIQAQAQAAMGKNDYDSARKIINDAQVGANSAINRDVTMHKNLEDALNGNQQAMVSLAGNHVLMVTGAGEKGAMRATKLIWQDAVKSAPWLQSVEAKFSKEGYLEGVTLTPEQMKQMVGLADEKVQILHDSTARLNQDFGAALSVHTQGAGNEKKKPSSSGPPRPPLSSFEQH